jgi:hypothetical protein
MFTGTEWFSDDQPEWFYESELLTLIKHAQLQQREEGFGT